MSLFKNKNLIYALLFAFMASAMLPACSSNESKDCKDDPDCIDEVM
jgi:hypothetical protein